MPKYIVKAFATALAAALWLRFLLPATGWLFYELHHATGIGWVYWGYTVFRGGGHYLQAWPYHTAACAAVGAALFLLVAALGRRRGRSPT